jgi:hypothetical protein
MPGRLYNMAETKIKILDVREFPSTEPTRVGKFDKIVTYQIDPFRTYLITLPKETFSEEKVKEAIRKDMAEREKWIGKELSM